MSSAVTQGALRVSDLSVGYDGKALMEHLNFEVPAGSIFAILGGSGTGKSTVLRHLIGLQAPMAGTIQLPDGEPPDLGGKPKFGAMFQSGALFGSMNLLDNVALPLRRWTEIDDAAIVEIAKGRLRLVSLGGFEHHFPDEISGGMKKRAGIARALALDPSLLFLDEPSAGLDPVSAVELDDLLLTLRDSAGVTTVIVTHELESIFKIVDDCIMLDKQAKTIIARGDPRVLRDESEDIRVRRFFNRLPERS